MICQEWGTAMISAPESRRRQAFLSSVVQSLLAKLREFAGSDAMLGKDDAEIERIAHDVGISGYELRVLATTRAGPSLLLNRRLSALRLDPHDPSRIPPKVLRDLQLHCSMCASRKRCAGDLAVRALESTWQDYCPNAPTLRALVEAAPHEAIEDLIVYLNTMREGIGSTDGPEINDRARRH
jgi:hypothetical protein